MRRCNFLRPAVFWDSMRPRRVVQRGIRNVHRLLLKRPLPSRIAISFHALEEPNWNAFSEMVSFFRKRKYGFCGADGLCSDGANRAVFVSFDDNFQSWYRALPFLGELDVKVTFYANTLPLRDRAEPDVIDDYYDRISHEGDRTPLSSDELMTLSDRGHSIGCHTHSHSCLGKLSEDEARSEILRGKRKLEEILGQSVVDFTYPFGLRRHFRRTLKAYCREIGLKTVANCIPAMQFHGHRPYSIHRSRWDLGEPLDYNVENLCIDGRIFAAITGRSAVG
jgi:peptidoglycan/xylan/chitin deacetylase (PgdA/CDA1 family)